jgi:hypothetical protein
MNDFSKAFLRLDVGRWLCRQKVTIQSGDGHRLEVTPGVTYTRGKRVDGVDVAQWLDDFHEKRSRPAGGWRSVPSNP